MALEFQSAEFGGNNAGAGQPHVAERWRFNRNGWAPTRHARRPIVSEKIGLQLVQHRQDRAVRRLLAIRHFGPHQRRSSDRSRKLQAPIPRPLRADTASEKELIDTVRSEAAFVRCTSTSRWGWAGEFVTTTKHRPSERGTSKPHDLRNDSRYEAIALPSSPFNVPWTALASTP